MHVSIPENCERVGQVLIIGIKISLNVISFLDPFLLQENKDWGKNSAGGSKTYFFNECINAGNSVKFQVLKSRISPFGMKSGKSFAQGT